MFRVLLVSSAVIACAVMPSSSLAQAGRGRFSYPAPAARTYNYPGYQPYGNRDAYIAFGTVGAGAAATYFSGGNPYAGLGGAAAGGYYGGQVYDNLGRPQTTYYAPRGYGTQTTTPYMVRRGNR